MVFTNEVFLIEDTAYGYRIFDNGKIICEQIFRPGLKGHIFMTQLQATNISNAIVALKNSNTIPGIFIYIKTNLTFAQKTQIKNWLTANNIEYETF